MHQHGRARRVVPLLPVVALLPALALLGLVVPTADAARPPELLELPAADEARGLVVADLAVARRGPCAGALELTGVARPGSWCTHGPDAAPADIGDVRRAELTSAEADALAAAAPPFECDGDGLSGRRAHAIYAVTPDRVDRYDEYVAGFRGIVADVQDSFRRSSELHGADLPLVYRFTHTAPDAAGRCRPLVDHVVLDSAADDDTFSATINALVAKGYDDPSRRYLVFADATGYCGIANYWGDDSASGNANDRLISPLFSRVDAGCWGYAETHELAHNIGAVQGSAPNASGSGHCNDEYDVMCYADGGSTSSVFVRSGCEDRARNRLLDCGGDDYFNPSPAPGSYLDTHWNIARSSWLFEGAPVPAEPDPDPRPDPDPTPDPPRDRPPSVSVTRPADGAEVPSRVRWAGKASDADGDLRAVRLRVDGRVVATVPTGGNWGVWLELDAGRHRLEATALDESGNSSTTARRDVRVVVDTGDDNADRFIDDDGSIFEDDIERLASTGITRGCNPPANDRFCPRSTVTRGVMAAFLARALDLPAASGTDFVDDDRSVFERDIERLAAAGITRGCNPPANDRFCPDAPVTRGAMAAFLSRSLDRL